MVALAAHILSVCCSTVVAKTAEPTPTVTHRIRNLTGCGQTRSCGAMGAAAWGISHVAFGGGGSLDRGRFAAMKPPPPPASKAVDVVDLASLTVVPAAPMPVGHDGDSNSAVSVLGLTFFCGGTAPADCGGGTISIWNSSSSSWAVPPRADSWTIPERRFLACAAATVTDGSKGVVVCGGGEGPKGGPDLSGRIDIFEVYASHTNIAQSVRLLPNSMLEQHGVHLSQPRKKAAAAGVDDILMIATGYSDTGHPVGYSAQFDMFNITSGIWSSGVLPSKSGRQYGTATGCGDVLLFGGGQIAGGRYGGFDAYNTRTKTWSTGQLSIARSNLAAACLSGRYALFAGGQIPGRTTVDMIDVQTMAVSQLTPLNYGRGWLVGAGAGKCVAFGGGGSRPQSTENTTFGDVDIYCVQ